MYRVSNSAPPPVLKQIENIKIAYKYVTIIPPSNEKFLFIFNADINVQPTDILLLDITPTFLPPSPPIAPLLIVQVCVHWYI